MSPEEFYSITNLPDGGSCHTGLRSYQPTLFSSFDDKSALFLGDKVSIAVFVKDFFSSYLNNVSLKMHECVSRA